MASEGATDLDTASTTSTRTAGGPTSLANGRGVCARGKYVHEMPGWRVEVVHDGRGRHPHTVRTTTPTGHTYVSRAGPVARGLPDTPG